MNIEKRANRQQTQVQSEKFDVTEHRSVFSFLSAFKMACDTNEINERAHVAVSFVMERSSAVAVNVRLFLAPTSSSSTHSAEESMSRAYAEVVNYLF